MTDYDLYIADVVHEEQKIKEFEEKEKENMSTTRKIKRNQIKQELGTNDISREFHKRYGEKSNVDKTQVKLLDRLKRKLRKLAHKKARERRANNE